MKTYISQGVGLHLSRAILVSFAASLGALAGCVGMIEGAQPGGAAGPDGAIAVTPGDIGDPVDAAPPPTTPDAAPPTGEAPPSFGVSEVSRASTMSIVKASVGYTYWWGHGGLGGDKAGTCSGNCPNCTHAGGQGADCSGLIGKAWLLPEALPLVGTDKHPFSTYDFRYGTKHWAPIKRDDVLPGDAMVHNENGAGHIFIYEKDDPWGDMWSYEARGCSWGVVHNIRTADSSFIAIRRTGF